MWIRSNFGTTHVVAVAWPAVALRRCSSILQAVLKGSKAALPAKLCFEHRKSKQSDKSKAYHRNFSREIWSGKLKADKAAKLRRGVQEWRGSSATRKEASELTHGDEALDYLCRPANRQPAVSRLPANETKIAAIGVAAAECHSNGFG